MNTKPQMEFRINGNLYGMILEPYTDLFDLKAGWRCYYARIDFACHGQNFEFHPNPQMAVCYAIQRILTSEGVDLGEYEG